MSAPPLSLKGRAVQWLSQREHSRLELRRKLLAHLRNTARREAARADAAQTRASACAEARREAEADSGAWAGAGASAGRVTSAFARHVGVRTLATIDADVHAHWDANPNSNLDSDAGTGSGSGTECAPEDIDPSSAFAAQVDKVLDWLVANCYLSEARFVESRVHARGVRYGNLRIKHELAQHGVALTAEQSQQLQTTEFDRAQAVWSRKFGAAPVDLRERAKHMRFLAARGFSMPVITRVLKHARTAPPEADSDGDSGLTWGDAGG
jgi:SOS response regulatory protein OraA/RecX